jgi:16S rRNA (guanine527-N7)-methyltransferase
MTPLAAGLLTLALAPDLENTLNNFSILFHRWNRSINLSAARSEHELRDHILDSLHVVPHLRAATAGSASPPALARILDVGAGGGLPAVVAAICLPDTHIIALEPVHKKHAFLRTAARELALPNLEPLAERVDRHPGRDYMAAMSRATFDLREWLLLGLMLVRPGGVVLGFEGIPRSDLPPDTQRHPYTLGDKSRSIVAVRRAGLT